MNIYVNLPVADLDRSRAFFQALGFSFDERFSDETAAGMPIDEGVSAMLLTHAKFAQFTDTPVADAHQATEVLTCLQVDSRAEVDRLVDAALSNGGARVGEPQDHGFMYLRSFRDPDGHVWEIVWMDPAQIPEEE